MVVLLNQYLVQCDSLVHSLVHSLRNDPRGTGSEVRVAGVNRGDRLRADSQAAGGEGRYARGEGCSVPIVVPLSRKFTVPVGVPVPGETAATVAVNVTD